MSGRGNQRKEEEPSCRGRSGRYNPWITKGVMLNCAAVKALIGPFIVQFMVAGCSFLPSSFYVIHLHEELGKCGSITKEFGRP